MMSLGEERGVFMATNMFAFDPLQSQANMGLPHTSYLSRAPRAVPVEKNLSCGEISNFYT